MFLLFLQLGFPVKRMEKQLNTVGRLTASVTKLNPGNRFPLKRNAIYFEHCLC